jgi:hypothetical protein
LFYTPNSQYLLKAQTDPSLDPSDLPPALASNAIIKYPDIYNRYRKLKGPIRAIKIPKSRRQPNTTQPVKRKKRAHSQVDGSPTDLSGLGATPAGVNEQFGTEVKGEEMGDDVDVRMGEELVRLAAEEGHVDLAQALMRLPVVSGGIGDEHLDEAVRRLAQVEGGIEDVDEGDKAEGVWDGL